MVTPHADPGNWVVHLFDDGSAGDHLDPFRVVVSCGNVRLFFLRIPKKPFAMSGANASPIGRSDQKDERSECKPDRAQRSKR